MNEPTVTLDEIAATQGRKADQVRADVDELGMQVRTDWAGRAALTLTDARALFSGTARVAADHRDAWQQHVQACEQWTADRDAAARDAADDAERKTRNRPAVRLGRAPSSPAEVQDARRRAHLHAGAQYERSNPRPRWNGEPTIPLVYLDDPEEEGSKRAAALGRIRGPKTAPGVEVA